MSPIGNGPDLRHPENRCRNPHRHDSHHPGGPQVDRGVAEFSRRNVFPVGAAYLVATWLLIQVAETLFPLFGFGDSRPARIVVVVLAIGFVPALVLTLPRPGADGHSRDFYTGHGNPVAQSNFDRNALAHRSRSPL